MAKINIEFDGKIYSVDEATLLPLASPLERALVQQLAGTGAIIRLGGTDYNVDANKLASARNVLTNHLDNVAGTDSKVTINGTEYGLSKTKLQGATDKMIETLSSIGTATILPGLYETGSNYSVMTKSWAELLDTCVTVENGALKRKIKAPDNLPEKNEYGFYYGVKYYLNCDKNNYGNNAGDYCFFENGQYEYSDYDSRMQAPYECEDNTIKIFIYDWDSEGEYYLKEDCTLTISSDGLRLVKGPGIQDEYACGEEIGFAYSADYTGEVVLPNDDSITCIDNAFIGAWDSESYSSAYYINHVLLPDSIQEIKAEAFYRCGLNTIDIPKKVTRIEHFTFFHSLLESVNFPDTVTYIGSSAFAGCGLYTLKLPTELRTIEASAFSGNDLLASVTIPSKVVSIGADAFYRCTSLDHIIIPDSVEEIGENAFERCDVLKDIYIDKPENSVSGAPWGAPNAIIHWNSAGPEEQNISNGSRNLRYVLNEDGQSYAVETIGSCEDLDIIIPDTYNNLPITAISDNAFNIPSCAKINSITMSNNITSIGNYAFGRCDNLTLMTIGNGIVNIAWEAFDDGLYNNFDLYIDKTKDSVSGAPWSGYYGNSVTIHWTDATDIYEWHEAI